MAKNDIPSSFHLQTAVQFAIAKAKEYAENINVLCADINYCGFKFLQM